MNEQLTLTNETTAFVDEEGNTFNLDAPVYEPKDRVINSLVLGGIAAAVRAGRSPLEF